MTALRLGTRATRIRAAAGVDGAHVAELADGSTAEGHEVMLESGAGEPSKYSDHDYSEAGATIAYSTEEVYKADIILKVYDSQEQLIWSPSVMEEQENRQMMSSHMSQMNEMMGGTENEYTVTTVELNDGDRIIGSLAIGTMGTYFYTEHDVSFMSDIRNNLLKKLGNYLKIT